jgi:hypothetical protein
MDRLAYELRHLTRDHREGSFSTQEARWIALRQASVQLREEGFRNLSARGLKPKHVQTLLERWQREELSTGTIKNRLSHIRWAAGKLGKGGIIPRSNDALGIERRQYVSNTSKARQLTDRAQKITDPRVRASLELQRHFGLRLEESLKFQPAYADRGERIVLKGSWTKGGRPREIPVRTPEQRALLDKARQIAGGGSLIPPERSYIQHRWAVEKALQRAGIDHVHGHRHAYAQERYEQLTGWKAPADQGPTHAELNPAQRQLDREARLTISAELGHGREQITTIYLGR